MKSEQNRQQAKSQTPDPNTSFHQSQRTSLSTPFFLSPTGLRAHQMNCKRSDLSLKPAPLTETDNSKLIPALNKPRRRLLFLSPTGLYPTEDNPASVHKTLSAPYNSTKSVSQHDLRPRWIDLNNYPCNSSSSSLQTADNSPPFSTDKQMPVKVVENETKVKTWLNSRHKAMTQQRRSTIEVDISPRQYETQL